MRISVSTLFHVSGRDDELESHLDDVMERLLEIGVLDPSIGGSLASGQVEVSVDVEAKNIRRTLRAAFDIVLRAITAAGGTVIDSLGEPIQSHRTDATNAPSWDRKSLSVAA
ncbi:MAG: hypothetical protein WD184_05365 [Acidimicrobiia bacterium]